MKRATLGYIQEEGRRCGARPRLKAEIGPFVVDPGLGPGLGSFVNCACLAPGMIELEPGYVTAASWTSDIRQTGPGRLTAVTPGCLTGIDYMNAALYVRSSTRWADVGQKSWCRVDWGTRILIETYFQVKIEFAGCLRSWAVDEVGAADDMTAYATAVGRDVSDSWAVDGAFPGRLENFSLTGIREISEAEIIACSPLSAARPAWFDDLQSFSHTLTVDNRAGQYIPGHQNFLMAEGLWFGKEIQIYVGFELPTGEVAWIRQYVGRIRDIREIGHAFQGRHQAKIVSRSWVQDVLQQLLGGPAADGSRQPFLAGSYRAKAELRESRAPYLGQVTKIGAGGATLVALGRPTNGEDRQFLVEAESSGEISVATIRWSVDGGGSWEKTGVLSMTSAAPLPLKDGVLIYFEPGGGTDLVVGDRFAFTAFARRTTYVLPGAPFQAITDVYLNGVEMSDVEVHEDAGEIVLTGATGTVEARLVASATTNPVEIIREILQLTGLAERIDEDAFARTKQALADYQIGVRFEGVPAWQAIREICRACLIFFWIDADRIGVGLEWSEQ